MASGKKKDHHESHEEHERRQQKREGVRSISAVLRTR
jgi:hypothetical protein